MPDPANTVYKVALNCTHLSGIRIVNLFWFAALDSAHDANGLGTDFANQCKVPWQACVSKYTAWNTTEVTTFPMGGATQPAPLTLNIPGVVGVESSSATTGGAAPAFQTKVLPPVLCQHAVLRTPLIGRSRRGRLYFPPAPELDQTLSSGAFWNPSYVTAFQAFLNFVFNRYSFGGTSGIWEWGIWSRRFGGNSHVDSHGRTIYTNKPPFNFLGFTPINSVVALGGIRTQRRREAAPGT